MDVALLSPVEKAWFFEELDAVVAASRDGGTARARTGVQGGGRGGTDIDAPRPPSSPSTVTSPAPQLGGNSAMRQGAAPAISPNDVICLDDSVDNGLGNGENNAPLDRNDSMTRTLPQEMRKRQHHSSTQTLPNPTEARSKSTATAKRRRNTSLESSEQLLAGQRIMLVPIGTDVSRKRLEIWEDMVNALGGKVVYNEPAVRLETSISSELDLRSDSAIQHHPSCVISEDSGDHTIGVDAIIVSAKVDVERLLAYYRWDAIPSNVQFHTPEWLVEARQTKSLPPNILRFNWRELQRHLSNEEINAVTELAPVPSPTESGNEDGSDIAKETSKEIVRAPPVHLDTAKIKQEEETLRIKKEQLVKERTPIFHKLNPNFKSISDGEQGRRVRAEAFICQKSSLMQSNLNAHLTEPLEELMEFLHVERDTWREYSYKKVVSSLKAMRTRVSSVSDLKGLWWAKGRLRDKVVEVLETGKIEKLEAKKGNPRLRTLVEMSRIWGVGPATAAKLYSSGYKSMESLRQHASEILSTQQQIGLKHYHDFLTKIPRDEVAVIEKTVVDEVHKLVPRATALACGSYRRGKASSGDCDVLITDPDSEECDILPELLQRLHARGFLTDDLTHVSEHHMGGCDTYMGVCQVRSDLPHRRLDIKVYPRRFFGFALLYFTGSDHFNRSMRLFAHKKGWSLSDRSLKRVVRPKKGVKIETGDSVICPHEVDVFIALGLEYKDPSERNCFDIRFLEEDEANAKRK